MAEAEPSPTPSVRKDAPPPHDFRDHKAHMQWQMERNNYVTAVPLIPQDMSQGSRAGSLSSSVLQKAFSNPFVPIGMMATVGCLVGMLGATLKRNSNRAQLYMRGRVLAQGLTVAALVGGALMFGLTPNNSPPPSISLPLGPPKAQPASQ